MPPHLQVADFAPVDLSTGPVLFATYTPIDQCIPHDVTQLVRQLQINHRGDLSNLLGGIHNFIGDPFPNRSKIFKVYFANRPDQTFSIPSGDNNNNNSSTAMATTTISLKPHDMIIAACYVGDGENYFDVVDKIRALQMDGVYQNIETSRLRKILGDVSDERKTLKIWYA